ncbi:MAG TPA: aspartyl protease family protein [Chloroflexota bacterium]|nr:aspartyl protease family protein [Chloroflexota bacterium]
MGTFSVPIQVGDHEGTRWHDLEALVDTGATFTVIPPEAWESLGLTTSHRLPFELGDGRRVELDLAEARVRIDGQDRVGYVVAGEPGSSALLGAVTLETFLLAPDPVHKRLVPVTGLLL